MGVSGQVLRPRLQHLPNPAEEQAFANVFPQLIEAPGKRGIHTCQWEKLHVHVAMVCSMVVSAL